MAIFKEFKTDRFLFAPWKLCGALMGLLLPLVFSAGYAEVASETQSESGIELRQVEGVTEDDDNEAAQIAKHFVKNENTGVVYNNLQTAINAASAGDTLKIHGTFVGNFTINKDLTLRGKNDATLDGGATGSVLSISSGVFIEHLIIQNGLATNGGGIFNEGDLTLKHVHVINNIAAQNGGGIFNDGGDLTTENDTKISGNQAGASGGGIYNGEGSTSIVDTELENNSAQTSGGGIFSALGSLTITKSKLIANSTRGAGGGLFNATNNVILSHVKFLRNQAGEAGGIFNGLVTISLYHSKVHANLSATDGGGVYNTGTANFFKDTKVTNNIASIQGGGIFNATGGVLDIEDAKVARNSPDNVFNQ